MSVQVPIPIRNNAMNAVATEEITFITNRHSKNPNNQQHLTASKIQGETSLANKTKPDERRLKKETQLQSKLIETQKMQ